MKFLKVFILLFILVFSIVLPVYAESTTKATTESYSGRGAFFSDYSISQIYLDVFFEKNGNVGDVAYMTVDNNVRDIDMPNVAIPASNFVVDFNSGYATLITSVDLNSDGVIQSDECINVEWRFNTNRVIKEKFMERYVPYKNYALEILNHYNFFSTSVTGGYLMDPYDTTTISGTVFGTSISAHNPEVLQVASWKGQTIDK